MSYKKQDRTVYPSRASEFTPLFLVGTILLIFVFFVCCPIMFSLRSEFRIVILRYDFHIKAMFGSSLPPVVCWRVRVLFVCPRLVYPMLPVSLDCQFLTVLWAFSTVYCTISFKSNVRSSEWGPYRPFYSHLVLNLNPTAYLFRNWNFKTVCV